MFVVDSQSVVRRKTRFRKVAGIIALLSCLVALSAQGATAPEPDKEPERKVVARVEPEYPETLKRLYIGGIVRLEVTVAAKGQVENVTLLGGSPILGQSAMSAVKKWRYAPASARSVLEVKISFDPYR